MLSKIGKYVMPVLGIAAAGAVCYFGYRWMTQVKGNNFLLKMNEELEARLKARVKLLKAIRTTPSLEKYEGWLKKDINNTISTVEEEMRIKWGVSQKQFNTWMSKYENDPSLKVIRHRIKKLMKAVKKGERVETKVPIAKGMSQELFLKIYKRIHAIKRYVVYSKIVENGDQEKKVQFLIAKANLPLEKIEERVCKKYGLELSEQETSYEQIIDNARFTYSLDEQFLIQTLNLPELDDILRLSKMNVNPDDLNDEELNNLIRV